MTSQPELCADSANYSKPIRRSSKNTSSRPTPVNPGNSGGLLVDFVGHVIGINAPMLQRTKDIGFAVPINTVKSIVAELQTNGRVIRPWPGINGKFVTDELRNLIALPLMNGVPHRRLDEQSPAELIGLRPDTLDVTVEGESWVLGGNMFGRLDRHKVKTLEQNNHALGPLKTRQSRQLAVVRGDD